MDEAFAWRYLCITKQRIMRVKQTIAFIGDMDDTCRHLLEDLVLTGYPLIRVTKEDMPVGSYHEIAAGVLDADVEVVSCAREGCWQADVIMLHSGMKDEDGLWTKIREVANQKIMVIVSEDIATTSSLMKERAAFQQLLPHAEWVQAIAYPAAKEIDIIGTAAAADDVADIFSSAKYKTILLQPVEN